VTGKTVGGMNLYPAANTLDREQALRLWTEGNTWFSTEGGKKGAIKAGQLADLAVLSDDYFSVPEDAIAGIESVLTLLGGQPVFGSGDFETLAPPAPPVVPDWSPVKTFGGYQRPRKAVRKALVANGRSAPPAAVGKAARFMGMTMAKPGQRPRRPVTRGASGARSGAPAGRYEPSPGGALGPGSGHSEPSRALVRRADAACLCVPGERRHEVARLPGRGG
jgi:hypothetical protein